MKNPWDAARFMHVQILRTYLMCFYAPGLPEDSICGDDERFRFSSPTLADSFCPVVLKYRMRDLISGPSLPTLQHNSLETELTSNGDGALHSSPVGAQSASLSQCPFILHHRRL